jgi:hypothetical protein
MRVVWKGEDKIGSRKFRALKSLGIALRTPSMDTQLRLAAEPLA